MLEEQKGSSLLIKHVSKFDIKDSIEIPLQTEINKFRKATDTIRAATSKITHVSKNADGNSDKLYLVEQYTPTIVEPIRFYLNGLQEYDKGYQRRAAFPLLYNKQNSMLFIFANIFHSGILLDRFENIKKDVVLEDTSFDFDKFTLIPEIKNIWGVWERVNLAHKRTNASFGNEVNKSPDVKLSQATSINLKMEIKGKMYTLAISRDGRISTQQRLKKEELAEIFDKYFKKHLSW